MSLKLMYITNRPEIALIAEHAGVDRIFIDMEYIGKAARQGGMDTVQNHHTPEDVRRIRGVLTAADLLVRVNPIHEAAADGSCGSSEEEIEEVLAAGADIVMLPYFKTAAEVRRFVQIVGGRARTMLLLETPEAADALEEILQVPGVDEIHIGINDLSLGYGRDFMFQLLADGTVERLCLRLRDTGIPYGFGGVAAVGTGTLPAEAILREHYRLGSSMVILSRSFCRTDPDTDPDQIRDRFETGVRVIRAFEKEIEAHSLYFENNRREVMRLTEEIAGKIRQARQKK